MPTQFYLTSLILKFFLNIADILYVYRVIGCFKAEHSPESMIIMENTVSLQKYKEERKKLFLKKNQEHLQRYFQQFVKANFCINYAMINKYYLADKISSNDLIWDYDDFRDLLKNAIKEVYGDQI